MLRNIVLLFSNTKIQSKENLPSAYLQINENQRALYTSTGHLKKRNI
jgi:hypothetical protein